MFEFAKKKLFKYNMNKAYSHLTSAETAIRKADKYALIDSKGNYGEQLIKDLPKNYFAMASRDLLEANKYLISASKKIPKHDVWSQYEIVSIILKYDNPVKYYSNYYGLEFMYTFKTKIIDKMWKEQKAMFVEYTKDLIEYDYLLKKMLGE